jgi:hypothetical protein
MGRGRSRRRDEVDVVAWLRRKGEIERAEWLRRTGLCSLTLMELCEIALAKNGATV